MKDNKKYCYNCKHVSKDARCTIKLSPEIATYGTLPSIVNGCHHPEFYKIVKKARESPLRNVTEKSEVGGSCLKLNKNYNCEYYEKGLYEDASSLTKVIRFFGEMPKSMAISYIIAFILLILQGVLLTVWVVLEIIK
jgi:hypothetical protein